LLQPRGVGNDGNDGGEDTSGAYSSDCTTKNLHIVVNVEKERGYIEDGPILEAKRSAIRNGGVRKERRTIDTGCYSTNQRPQLEDENGEQVHPFCGYDSQYLTIDEDEPPRSFNQLAIDMLENCSPSLCE
jgi:hypothetical protein